MQTIEIDLRTMDKSLDLGKEMWNKSSPVYISNMRRRPQWKESAAQREVWNGSHLPVENLCTCLVRVCQSAVCTANLGQIAWLTRGLVNLRARDYAYCYTDHICVQNTVQSQLGLAKSRKKSLSQKNTRADTNTHAS